MAAIRYYGNVMTSTKWRLCVARFLHLQQYSRRLNLLFFFIGEFTLNVWRKIQPLSSR
jgi:hypothetical protein